KKSRKTAIYPKIGKSFVYPALGLGDEAGEVLGKIKKIFRDKKGIVGNEEKEEIKKELGDVLWYLAQLATELNLSLDNIAKCNIKKLTSRLKRKTLHGDGDNR
ncbi:nucleoside triphosphate pyrophosphohydrolase family protein, partial [Patescibacteria group bacterium]|nr:nucleoside triphosphate pyrophosphohydrolase family protein [Patescibacteria group bacterium]